MNFSRKASGIIHILPKSLAALRPVSQALLLSSVSSLVTAGCFLWIAYGKGVILGHFSGSLLLRCTIFLVFSLGAFSLSRSAGTSESKKHFARSNAVSSLPTRGALVLDWLAVIGLSLAIFYLFFLSSILTAIDSVIPHIWVLSQLVLMVGFYLQKALAQKVKYLESLGLAAVILGVAIKAVSFFPLISAYPFTLDWSEGSFLYNASLLFSKKIYGVSAPLPVLHPSRSLLQSLPYLLPSLPLWFHRLWQVLLWLGLTLVGAVALAKRLSLKGRLTRIIFTLWAFLFIFQGPIYYHLMVCAAIVLFGYNRKRFWQSLVVVLLASAWAGISRVNWFPVPGFLAAAIYFLEMPAGNKSTTRYLAPAVGWVIAGLATAIASQAVYILISGNAPELFSSSFSSPLLWDRLFPGVTNPLGVLPGLIWIAFPITWLILVKTARSMDAWNRWRLAGLGSILTALLAGGLVVSVKIGGGNNLHNLDAFLLLLLLTGSYLFFDRFTPDRSQNMRVFNLPDLVWAFMLVLPFIQAVTTPVKLTWPDTKAGMQVVQQLQGLIDEYKDQPGQILMLDNRQLLAFHYLKGVTMDPQYEMDFLMEMAMSKNETYFKSFYQDMASHRFSLIITETLYPITQDDTHPFKDENNAWVAYVATTILNDYVPVAKFPEANIEVLAPKN